MHVRVPIAMPPKVAVIAVATHGQASHQRWRVSGLWGLHLYRYSAELIVGGKLHPIHYGYAGWTPPGTLVEYRFQGLSTHLFCHVEWPEGPGEDLPLVAPIGTAHSLLWGRLLEASAWHTTDPHRMNIRFWDVAMEVASLMARPEAQEAPEAVRKALSIIEERLDETLSVASLAEAACVSHNHLTRLFRQSLGKTVTHTIQERRVARARHLLERSDLPIKEVASMVGLPDLQQFNKTVRKHLGRPPSIIRESFKNGDEHL
jgi:AraC-like DNA-binding protein